MRSLSLHKQPLRTTLIVIVVVTLFCLAFPGTAHAQFTYAQVSQATVVWNPTPDADGIPGFEWGEEVTLTFTFDETVLPSPVPGDYHLLVKHPLSPSPWLYTVLRPPVGVGWADTYEARVTAGPPATFQWPRPGASSAQFTLRADKGRDGRWGFPTSVAGRTAMGDNTLCGIGEFVIVGLRDIAAGGNPGPQNGDIIFTNGTTPVGPPWPTAAVSGITFRFNHPLDAVVRLRRPDLTWAEYQFFPPVTGAADDRDIASNGNLWLLPPLQFVSVGHGLISPLPDWVQLQVQNRTKAGGALPGVNFRSSRDVPSDRDVGQVRFAPAPGLQVLDPNLSDAFLPERDADYPAIPGDSVLVLKGTRDLYEEGMNVRSSVGARNSQVSVSLKVPEHQPGQFDPDSLVIPYQGLNIAYATASPTFPPTPGDPAAGAAYTEVPRNPDTTWYYDGFAQPTRARSRNDMLGMAPYMLTEFLDMNHDALATQAQVSQSTDWNGDGAWFLSTFAPPVENIDPRTVTTSDFGYLFDEPYRTLEVLVGGGQIDPTTGQALAPPVILPGIAVDKRIQAEVNVADVGKVAHGSSTRPVELRVRNAGNQGIARLRFLPLSQSSEDTDWGSGVGQYDTLPGIAYVGAPSLPGIPKPQVGAPAPTLSLGFFTVFVPAGTPMGTYRGQLYFYDDLWPLGGNARFDWLDGNGDGVWQPTTELNYDPIGRFTYELKTAVTEASFPDDRRWTLGSPGGPFVNSALGDEGTPAIYRNASTGRIFLAWSSNWDRDAAPPALTANRNLYWAELDTSTGTTVAVSSQLLAGDPTGFPGFLSPDPVNYPMLLSWAHEYPSFSISGTDLLAFWHLTATWQAVDGSTRFATYLVFCLNLDPTTIQVVPWKLPTEQLGPRTVADLDSTGNTTGYLWTMYFSGQEDDRRLRLNLATYSPRAGTYTSVAEAAPLDPMFNFLANGKAVTDFPRLSDFRSGDRAVDPGLNYWMEPFLFDDRWSDPGPDGTYGTADDVLSRAIGVLFTGRWRLDPQLDRRNEEGNEDVFYMQLDPAALRDALVNSAYDPLSPWWRTADYTNANLALRHPGSARIPFPRIAYNAVSGEGVLAAVKPTAMYDAAGNLVRYGSYRAVHPDWAGRICPVLPAPTDGALWMPPFIYVNGTLVASPPYDLDDEHYPGKLIRRGPGGAVYCTIDLADGVVTFVQAVGGLPLPAPEVDTVSADYTPLVKRITTDQAHEHSGVALVEGQNLAVEQSLADTQLSGILDKPETASNPFHVRDRLVVLWKKRLMGGRNDLFFRIYSRMMYDPTEETQLYGAAGPPWPWVMDQATGYLLEDFYVDRGPTPVPASTVVDESQVAVTTHPPRVQNPNGIRTGESKWWLAWTSTRTPRPLYPPGGGRLLQPYQANWDIYFGTVSPRMVPTTASTPTGPTD